MKDYCTFGSRQIERTFQIEGILYCLDCRQPLCCDFVLIDPSLEPHPAAICDDGRFACWSHWNGDPARANAHTAH